MSPRFDLDGTESVGGSTITSEIVARLCGLSDSTAKTTGLLVEIRDLLKDMNAKLERSLEKGDALLAAGARLEEVGGRVHLTAGDLKEALSNAPR